MSQFPNVHFLLSAASEAQFPEDSVQKSHSPGVRIPASRARSMPFLVRNGLARASKTPGRTRLLNFFEIETAGESSICRVWLSRSQSGRKKAVDRTHRKVAGACLHQWSVSHRDIRRGVTDQDEQLLDWAGASGWPVHMLLTKADKLNQRDRAAALKDAQERIGEGMTAQVFSATDKIGIPAAQKRLDHMLRHPPVEGTI
jgi:GTP-binding protein